MWLECEKSNSYWGRGRTGARCGELPASTSCLKSRQSPAPLLSHYPPSSAAGMDAAQRGQGIVRSQRQNFDCHFICAWNQATRLCRAERGCCRNCSDICLVETPFGMWEGIPSSRKPDHNVLFKICVSLCWSYQMFWIMLGQPSGEREQIF